MTATVDRPTSPWPEIHSEALEDWRQQKKLWKQSNPHVDAVMDLVRIEHIKAEFVALNSLVRTMKKQGLDVAKGGFNAIFVGNTATGEIQRQPHPAFNHSNAASAGKTTIAELYASYLHSVEAIPYDNILRISAINLDTLGVQGVERKLGQLDLGGAFILEEIPPHSRVGLQRDPRRLPLPFIQGRRAARKGCFHFLPAAESTWTRFAHPVRRFPAYSQRCSGRGGDYLVLTREDLIGASPLSAALGNERGLEDSQGSNRGSRPSRTPSKPLRTRCRATTRANWPRNRWSSAL